VAKISITQSKKKRRKEEEEVRDPLLQDWRGGGETKSN